ncbi:hypothetical protein DTO164E3_8774 [Paecilomyces variotii]|nr:hypothetical protein DTO164E3_8774 [Paecilomyces variotii]
MPVRLVSRTLQPSCVAGPTDIIVDGTMEVDLIRIKDYPVSEGDFCIYNSSPAERLVLREFRTGKVCVPVD